MKLTLHSFYILATACAALLFSTVTHAHVDHDLAIEEARALLQALEEDGGTPFNYDNPATVYPSEANVFMPSVLGLDFTLLSDGAPFGPTVRLPMFKGFGPGGDEVDYIITEASNREVADILGVVYAPRMAAARGTLGVQKVTLREGRMVFRGSVDFSPKHAVVPGDPETSPTLSEFPPASVSPGGIADFEWSSLVVLPSKVVLNAQVVANSTGIHDRIPGETEDDQNNPNLDRVGRAVVMQILDGWHADKRYFFHLVTDSSAPVPAAIELGFYAPRLSLIPTAGRFPRGARLGFSPVANGVNADDVDPEAPQGLNNTVLDQAVDPVNIFPISPANRLFSPMWDAHINMWTPEAVAAGQRRVITSIDDLRGLIEQGLVTNFVGNSGRRNPFIAGLMPTNAIINCPVIAQPEESAIGRFFGSPTN